MASGLAGISGAGNLQDDVDYSHSHRPPPAPPSLPSTASPHHSPEFTQQQFAHHQHTRQKSSGGGSILKKPRSRKNSLVGLLRKSSLRAQKHTPEEGVYANPLTAPPLPPVPYPAQYPYPAAPPIPHDDPNKHFHFGNAATVTSTAYPTPSNHPRPSHSFDASETEPIRRSTSIFRSRSRSKSRERGPNMLRRGSKAKQQQQQQQAELERRERQAQMLPKQPPQLPSHQALPGMPSFGGDGNRPDSFAIFNNAYSHRSPPPSTNVQHTTVRATAPTPSTANFSRPGNVSMSSARRDSSSSPAYALRGASASVSPPPVKAIPASNGDDLTERTASMTNRGRYDYTANSSQPGHVNSPRRMRRRKDPTPFNILVVGTKNSGKSSFISLLNHSLATRSSKRDAEHHPPQKKGNFKSAYVETELEGERIGLTLWDSVGLEKSIVDLQLREMTSFIESKFEETFAEEQKVMRSPGFRDTHIHCVFLVLDPLKLDANIASAQQSGGAISRVGGLDDDVDVQVLRALWEKTVVIPVIAKADTLTTQHMAFLKRAVWRSIKDNSMNPLDALELEDDEADDDREDSDVLPDEDDEARDSASNLSDSSAEARSKRTSKRASIARHSSQAGIPTDEEPYLPLSVLSPDPYTLPTSGHATEKELSRVFPWGSASPLNPQHCDFPRLRDSVFLEWRTDLRELSRARWYEQWRTSRLRNIPGTKMRIKGGVTPVAAVPREGRGEVRNFSSGGVPRTVSGATQSTGGAGSMSVGMALGSPTTSAA